MRSSFSTLQSGDADVFLCSDRERCVLHSTKYKMDHTTGHKLASGRATEALAVRSAVNLVWNNSDNSRRGGGGRSHRKIKRPPCRGDLVTRTEMGPHADELKVSQFAYL